MSITSVQGVVLTGLTAFALVACGGEEGPRGDGSTYGGGGAGGGAEQPPPGIPADAYRWPVAWMFKCYDIQEHVLIHGYIDALKDYEPSYKPSEATLRVGQILAFEPYAAVQNMASGVYPDEDHKFATVQGYRRCLLFTEPGTYPFFSYGTLKPMIGKLYVTE